MSTKYNLRTVADGAADAWDSAPKSHRPILRDCSDALMQAADETDRLQAIVDRLPKTADGVPITLWMPVWLICGGELTSVRISWIAADLSRIGTNSGWSVKPGECYSTREAAEKARKP